MADQPARLPPLNSLRVFHTVVRHNSFRSAAEELHVSPQAVSLQIKVLEEAIGVELFKRMGRTIEANEQATLLAHYVRAGFDEMAEGIRRVTRNGPRNRVNLNASPYFATRYLLDRLGRFRNLMPDADLRLTTMVDLPDFLADDVDVAIQWGFGSWKQHDQRLLLRDYKEVCCAPQLAGKIASPADLVNLPLLHPVLADRLWGDVLRHLGVTEKGRQGDTRFQDAATMRRATVAGLGVGLISTIDADEDLKLGKLIAPFGRDVMKTMPAEQVPGFYLVLPKAHRRAKPVAAFCDWVESEDWLQPVEPNF